MRRSILFTVLALGAQAAWAQEATDPTPPDDEVVVEETAGTGDAAEGADEVVADESDAVTEIGTEPSDPGTEAVTDEADDPATEVVTDEADDEGTVVEDDADDEGTEVADDESDDQGTEVVDDETDEPETGELVDEPTDSRSPTGAFHGGHHGTVSTLAQAGLGRVFGSLRSQGYGDIQIERVDDEISISAARGGEVRHLVVRRQHRRPSERRLRAVGSGLRQVPREQVHRTILAGRGKRDAAWSRVESRKTSGKSKHGDGDQRGGGKGSHELTEAHGNGGKSAGGSHGNGGGHGMAARWRHGNGGGKNKLTRRPSTVGRRSPCPTPRSRSAPSTARRRH